MPLEKVWRRKKTSLDTQSQLLKDMKTYFELYDPEKSMKDVELHKGAIDAMKEVEIERIQKEFDESLKDREESTKESLSEVRTIMSTEIKKLFDIAMNSFILLTEPQRKTILSGIRINAPNLLHGFKGLDETMTQKENKILLNLLAGNTPAGDKKED